MGTIPTYDRNKHGYVIDHIIQCCLGPSPMPSIVDDVDTAELTEALQDPQQLEHFVSDLHAAVQAVDYNLSVIASKDPVFRRALHAKDETMAIIRPTVWAETDECLARTTVLVVTGKGLHYHGRVSVDSLAKAQQELRHLPKLERLTITNAISRLWLLVSACDVLTEYATAEDNREALGYLGIIGLQLQELTVSTQSAFGEERTRLGRECLMAFGSLDAVASMLLLSLGDVWNNARARAEKTQAELEAR